MRSENLLRLLFVVYCAEAGLFFAVTPWSGAWSRAGLHLPWTAVHDWLLGTWPRAAISGFGLVHLLWAAHDLDLWWRDRRARSRAT